MNDLTVEGLKSQARTLRNALAKDGVEVSHSRCLETVAKFHDFADWNTATAIVQRHQATGESFDNGAKDVHISANALHFCKWQKIGHAIEIEGNSSAVLSFPPQISPYFEPQAVRMIGFDTKKPSVSRRFLIGSVEIGKSPQLACVTRHPFSTDDKTFLVSDIFSRSPALVNWFIFSTIGLARELEFHLSNINEDPITVAVNIWGNPVTSLDSYA